MGDSFTLLKEEFIYLLGNTAVVSIEQKIMHANEYFKDVFVNDSFSSDAQFFSDKN